MLAAGVVLSHIYQDVGVSGPSGTNSQRAWHSLDSRLGQGGTLVVMSIDRIGRRWLDTMGNIHDLQRRGVRIRSLADNEQSWASIWMPPPIRRSRSWAIPWRLCRLGVRPGTGVHATPYQGWFGEGEGGRQETGSSPPLSEEQEVTVIEMVAGGVSSGESPGPSAYPLRRSGAPYSVSSACASFIRHGDAQCFSGCCCVNRRGPGGSWTHLYSDGEYSWP